MVSLAPDVHRMCASSIYGGTMARSPRLRERYALYGPDRFSPTELLTLVLGAGSKGISDPHIAAELLSVFGSLSQLRAAPVQALSEVTGIGPARAVQVHAALQLAQRAQVRPTPARLDHPAALAAFLRPHLEHEPVEAFWVVCLNAQLQPNSCRVISRGSKHCTVVDPAEVFRSAVLLRSTAIAVAHNHPSGDPTPSHEDHALTKRLVKCGQLLGIPLIDHVVIGRHSHWSFADHDALPGRVDLRSFTGAAEASAEFRSRPPGHASPC